MSDMRHGIAAMYFVLYVQQYTGISMDSVVLVRRGWPDGLGGGGIFFHAAANCLASIRPDQRACCLP